jgi:hypothetical protein
VGVGTPTSHIQAERSGGVNCEQVVDERRRRKVSASQMWENSMSNLRFREVGFAIILVLTGYSSDVSAAPKEVHNCTTIAEPGSYVLSRNLDASGDCLVVAVSFVTIDFAGFTISGNGTGACIKDQNIPSVIVVRNGMVTNCQSGIDLHNSTDSLVEHMLVVRNGNGVGIAVNTKSAVVENIVNVNGGDGIGVSNGVARGNVVWSNGRQRDRYGRL